MLRSLGFGLGLETFAKFLVISVLVSKNSVSEKKYRFRFRKIWYRKKVSVSISENLVSEKESRYRFRKIWYRKKSLGIGFGKFGIRKKSRYRFRSKFWYRHSVSQGGHLWDPMGPSVWLMSLQMIHEAYKPVYMISKLFFAD